MEVSIVRLGFQNRYVIAVYSYGMVYLALNLKDVK